MLFKKPPTPLEPEEDNLEFFDSYGFKLDEEFKDISYDPGDRKILHKLVAESKYNHLVCNTVDLQSESSHDNTCGRWCIVRYDFRTTPIAEFEDYFLMYPSKLRDQLVTLLSLDEHDSRNTFPGELATEIAKAIKEIHDSSDQTPPIVTIDDRARGRTGTEKKSGGNQ